MLTQKELQQRPRSPAVIRAPPAPVSAMGGLNHLILSLQQTIGNQAVQQYLHQAGVLRLGPQTAAQSPGTGTQAPVSSSGAQAPAKRSWQDIWKDFNFAQVSDVARVPALVDELLDAAEASGFDADVLDTGMEFVKWLDDNGDKARAGRMVSALHTRFATAYLTGEDLPTGGLFDPRSPVEGDPGQLIALAEKAARAGQHDRAFEYFGVAHIILSYYALEQTEKSGETLAAGDDLRRYNRYHRFEGIYGEMGEIYGFYYQLEREALDRGDPTAAADARSQAAALQKEIQQNYSIAGAEVEVGETSQVKTAAGKPAFTFHGANYAETDLTELPGHPFSADLLKSHEGQQGEGLDVLQTALIGQADLQTELARVPEIRKAFKDSPIDLNDAAKRQKAWRIMYGVYSQSGGDALGSLMALVGRYLKAYTYHTGYNIRDFGANYIGSDMPSDLAGRLVRDCGVYALTVAWDVYKTLKDSGSKANVSFTLATFLDHVTLVIADKSAGEEYYLVNNDQITHIEKPRGYASEFHRPPGLSPQADVFLDEPDMPAKPVDLDDEVARQYASLRNLPYLVTPVNYLEIGSTATSATAFREGAWSKYLAATEYMSKVPVDFPMQEAFSQDAAALDTLVDELAAKSPGASDIDAFLSDGWPHIKSLLVRFEQIGPQAFKRIQPPANRPPGSRDVISLEWRKGGVHPLARIALILLRLQALGGTLTGEQRKYLEYCKKVFTSALSEHREQAEAGQF